MKTLAALFKRMVLFCLKIQCPQHLNMFNSHIKYKDAKTQRKKSWLQRFFKLLFELQAMYCSSKSVIRIIATKIE